MASYVLFLYYKSPALQFQVIWNTFYGAFVRIALPPGGTICEETTREDMIGTIYEMVRHTPNGF